MQTCSQAFSFLVIVGNVSLRVGVVVTVAGPVVVTIVEDIGVVVDVKITVDIADVVIAVAGGDTINFTG